ncbi:auxin-responsive protein SAUR36-like [Zingiber officinale]|uniref:auxin-responsive protein SAUR36-like n=1 Tax=Zingiber officinale TaxID=94328 RepID=UPI001C4B19B2|nr:auxin-responsive protein SAUR36-like [Zingiber officinale]
MKRFRGFRVGRRLARLWSRVAGRCPRRRPTSYVRLEPDGESDLFELSWAAKFLCWGRLLLPRCLRLGDAGGAGTAGGRRRTLAESPAREGQADGKGPGFRPPPRGHLAVYVGGEGDGAPPRRRYTVPVIYFNHPLFAELLREAQEEFGFHHPGGITIPCPAAEFERVRRIIAAAAKNDHEKLLRRSISAPL